MIPTNNTFYIASPFVWGLIFCFKFWHAIKRTRMQKVLMRRSTNSDLWLKRLGLPVSGITPVNKIKTTIQRRDEKRLFRRKKRDQEVKMHTCFKRLTEEFKSGASSYKGENRNQILKVCWGGGGNTRYNPLNTKRVCMFITHKL